MTDEIAGTHLAMVTASFVDFNGVYVFYASNGRRGIIYQGKPVIFVIHIKFKVA